MTRIQFVSLVSGGIIGDGSSHTSGVDQHARHGLCTHHIRRLLSYCRNSDCACASLDLPENFSADTAQVGPILVIISKSGIFRVVLCINPLDPHHISASLRSICIFYLDCRMRKPHGNW